MNYIIFIGMLISYLLVYNHGFILSIAADDASNWTSLANKRADSGFISIDCGMIRDSRDDNERGLRYVSNSEFISTGIDKQVDNNYTTFGGQRIYNTLRSFPDGNRNCYTLKPLQGKNGNYLIRASFAYENYDGLSTIPQEFDLYVGVHFWVTVYLDSLDKRSFYEIIYTPPEDVIYICLVKTGTTIPFISAIELKPLTTFIYNSSLGALRMQQRWNAGFNSSTESYSSALDDSYDRRWLEIGSPFWGSLNIDLSTNPTFADPYKLPPSVIRTAAVPVPSATTLNFQCDMGSLNTGLLYVYWHFAEIEKLGSNESREFTISIPGLYHSDLINPRYLQPFTVVSSPIRLLNGSTTIEFFIAKTNRSKHPPILNGFEIYDVVELSTSTPTDQNDVNAIMSIKANYTVPVSWQGDPCRPYGPWDGLKCSNNEENSPRITSLNLTSSGLAGDIPDALSTLTALTYLDLSYNNLTGVIPDFLAKLPSLHTIDLRNNMIVGQVPLALNKMAEDGSMVLRLEGNPDLCVSNHCKKKNSKKMVAILSSTSLIFIFIVIAIMMMYILKRKKAARYIRNRSLKLESRNFTYVEVMNMTYNFQTIIGTGGSGAVYQGSLQDGTPVAVKILDPSATLSLKFFRTEAELLTRVHHRNLVSLIGYCEEGTTMALIYEHVANGNLQQHISENKFNAEKNIKTLCWKERLQIAIDAAQGLEYMHSGCKPPIIHRDMKTSNILLDENMRAKISDFGISKAFPVESTTSDLSTNVLGTHGYVDPEYYSTRRLNKKSDVYSFGVVLLELITGHSPIVRGNGEPLHIIAWTTPKLESGDIENIVDKRLEGHFSTNSAWKALEIAMMCVSSTAIQRPCMNQVLIDLNDCLSIEMSQGTYRDMNNRGYDYSATTDIDPDIAIADSSIEMGPAAR